MKRFLTLLLALLMLCPGVYAAEQTAQIFGVPRVLTPMQPGTIIVYDDDLEPHFLQGGYPDAKTIAEAAAYSAKHEPETVPTPEDSSNVSYSPDPRIHAGMKVDYGTDGVINNIYYRDPDDPSGYSLHGTDADRDPPESANAEEYEKLKIESYVRLFAYADIQELPLDKTGTTYDFIDISFSPAVDLSAIENSVPGFQFSASDVTAQRVVSGQLEVRLLSEFLASREKAKVIASAYFSDAIADIVALAAKQDITLPPDLDDPEFQFFTKSQMIETEDQDIIALAKFIDIYENYEYNLKTKELASTLENSVFSSADEFVSDPSLKELLFWMPPANPPAATAVSPATEWWSNTSHTVFAQLMQVISTVIGGRK